MKILFIGCVESSRILLGRLIEEKKNVAGVITKEKSDFNSDFYDLSILCAEENIPCHYVKNINQEDGLEFVKSLQPDIGFCFGWSQLLKADMINLFPMGVVGFHPAALPYNRGRHPLIWALALGLEETASTFFMINSGVDAGDIVSQKKVLIDYEDDAGTLYDKVMDTALEQEMELVKAFETGTVQIQRMRQSEGIGNSWRKRGKTDGEIDWRMSSRNIYNLVRSLTKPYVGAHFVYGEKEYKVWKVREMDSKGLENMEPGKVLSMNEDGTIDVKTGDGAIKLLEYEAVMIKEGDYIL